MKLATEITVNNRISNTKEALYGRRSDFIASRRSDFIALGLLLLVPLLAIGIPSLLSYHVMMVWDNQIQNLPLRVLVGRDIAAGHLPLWDPFVWSGTPLLGGFNAGAFYPPVLLFALLPSFAAWALTWILTYWISVVGMYLLCRKLGMSTLPAAVATATYSFTGIMLQMVVHVMVIEADAWLPWMLLGIEGLLYAIRGSNHLPHYLKSQAQYDEPQSDTAADETISSQVNIETPALPWMKIVAWMILIASSLAMVILSGSTSSTAAAVIVAGFVILWHTAQRTPYIAVRQRIAFMMASLLACAWGIALSTTQLLVGLSFVGMSQRNNGFSGYLFGTFPLPFSRWLQAFLPGIAGGSGNFGLPSSALPINHNPYVGLLPLVAFFALAAVSVGRYRYPEAGKWTMWIVLAVVGVILAAASGFPGGSVLAHIPFYGGIRVQGRMVVMTDLAVSVVLGFWLERMIMAKNSTSTWTRTRKELIAGMIPMLIAVILAVAGLVYPSLIEIMLGVAKHSRHIGQSMWPLTIVTLILAIIGLLFVVIVNRIQPRSIRLFVTVFTVIDIGFFGATMAPGFQFFGINSLAPTASNFASTVADKVTPGPVMPGARYAIWDPNISNLGNVFHLAQPDQNVLGNISSIQGVGSAVWGTYDSVTCTHPFDSLRTSSLSSSISNELDIGTLLVAKDAFATSSSAANSNTNSTCLHGGYGSELGNNATEAAVVGTASSSIVSASSPASVTTTSGADVTDTVSSGSTSAPVDTSALDATSTTADLASTDTVSGPPPSTANVSYAGHGGVAWYVGSVKNISKVVIDVPGSIEHLLGRSIYRYTHAANHRHTLTPHRRGKRATPTVVPEIEIELLQSKLSTTTTTTTTPTPSAAPASSASSNSGATGSAPATGSTTEQSNTSSLIVAKSFRATRISQNKKYAIYSATLNMPVQAIAIRLVGTVESRIQPQYVHITTISQSGSPKVFTLNGPLVNAVRPGKWRYTGRIGDFISYYDTNAYGHLWFAEPGTTIKPGSSPPAPLPQAAGDSISIERFTSTGNETDRVSTTTPVLLVRSMVWAPGWSATIKGSNGHKITEGVSRYGLVQAVTLPQGTSTVSFSYWPPGMTEGVILTSIALLAIIIFVAVYIKKRLRLAKPRVRIP